MPDGAQSRFHRIAGGEASEAHPVAIAETRPVRTVFMGRIEQCAPTGADGSPKQTCRPYGTDCGPFEALFTGDRVGRTPQLRWSEAGDLGRTAGHPC